MSRTDQPKARRPLSVWAVLSGIFLLVLIPATAQAIGEWEREFVEDHLPLVGDAVAAFLAWGWAGTVIASVVGSLALVAMYWWSRAGLVVAGEVAASITPSPAPSAPSFALIGKVRWSHKGTFVNSRDPFGEPLCAKHLSGVRYMNEHRALVDLQGTSNLQRGEMWCLDEGGHGLGPHTEYDYEDFRDNANEQLKGVVNRKKYGAPE